MTMKYIVQLLNYDSEWVTYCKSSTKLFAQQAVNDLLNHGFKPYQIKSFAK